MRLWERRFRCLPGEGRICASGDRGERDVLRTVPKDVFTELGQPFAAFGDIRYRHLWPSAAWSPRRDR